MKKRTTYLILLIGVLLFAVAYYRSYSRAVDREVSTIFLSDSYDLSGSWIEEAAETAEMDRYRSASYAGVGFATTSDAEGEITDFTELLESTGGEDLVTSISWIVVLGGTNDQYYSQTEIEAGVQSFVDLAKDMYPSAQVIIGMDGWNADNEDSSNMLNNVASWYRAAAEKSGAWYMEGVEDVLKDQPEYFLEDGFHPNQDGGAQLGAFAGTYVKEVNQARLNNSLKERFIGLGMNIGALVLIFVICYGYGVWKKNKRRAKVKLIED